MLLTFFRQLRIVSSGDWKHKKETIEFIHKFFRELTMCLQLNFGNEILLHIGYVDILLQLLLQKVILLHQVYFLKLVFGNKWKKLPLQKRFFLFQPANLNFQVDIQFFVVLLTSQFKKLEINMKIKITCYKKVLH